MRAALIRGLVLFCFLAAVGLSFAAGPYKIGTYYFPGWRSNQAGAPAKEPWARIKEYPEREPLLGWYDDGDVNVVTMQLVWMAKYGIDFVIFDWYWNGRESYLEHSLKAYFRSPARSAVPFALLWANHTKVPTKKVEFDSMIRYWIDNYFWRPEYLRLDDKPVVFVFGHPELARQAESFGSSYDELLRSAEVEAQRSGYKGIYFVGGTHIHPSLVRRGAASGYSAFSAYNYHGRAGTPSISYRELDLAYREIWEYFRADSSLPYIIPMTQGWDKRPWGGSRVPEHDNSAGTPEEFRAHLLAAKRIMDASPNDVGHMGVICCWNEFGEGSVIEPTRSEGFTYLNIIREVFR